MRDRVESLREVIIQHGLAKPNEIRGCADHEIDRLASSCRVVFPATYRSFLVTFGHGAGPFLANDHWTAVYDDLAQLNGDVREYLREIVEIPDYLFCFASRMGEIYLFIRADGSSNDPPVFCWSERNENRLDVGYDSIWVFFNEMAADTSE